MLKNDFYVMRVSKFYSRDLESLTGLVFESGAAGTEEILPFEQSNREYEPVTLLSDITELKIYFESEPPPNLYQEILAQWPHSQVTLVGEANRDWLAEWKASFKPFSLVGDFWIVPSWCEVPPEAKDFLRMDPGMAFGTGTHETTRLAASFIFDFGKESLGSLVDVGTGTGLLALLAEKLNFSNIVANDIDPEARRVARENLEINHSLCIQVVDQSLEEIANQFDWVVANIIDGVLVKLQSDLKKRVKVGGYLVLTGILLEREPLFLSEFSFSGFHIVERRLLGEWVGFLLQSKS